MLITKLWRGAQRFIQEVGISGDFPRYEREKRAEHEAVAARRFDAGPLEREIAEIRRAAEAEGSAAYGASIQRLQSSLGEIRPEISTLRTRLELFTRNYRLELDQLYTEKGSLEQTRQLLKEVSRALSAERSAAKDELDDAYENLGEAKESINSWHAKSKRSPLLFGNGGKRLPRRAIFGQSMGDLNGYKVRRDGACDAIGDAESDVADIVARQRKNQELGKANQAELNRVNGAIRAANESKQRMSDLRRQGVHRHRIESALAERLRQEKDQQNELHHVTSAMDELIRQHACRQGINERLDAVAALAEKRARFLSVFDDPTERSIRQLAHREWYFAQRTAD